jgi:lysophospholipase L1-like esterase
MKVSRTLRVLALVVALLALLGARGPLGGPVHGPVHSPIPSQGQAPWTPAKLPGLFYLLDSSSSPLTLVSSTHISAAGDAAGGTYSLVQTTDADRPIVDTSTLLNGLQSIRTTTASILYSSSSPSGVQGTGAHSFGFVARFNATTNNYALAIIGATGGNFSALGEYSGEGYWYGREYDGSGAEGQYYIGTVDTTTAHSLVKTVSGSGVVRLYVDGYLLQSGTFANPLTDTGYHNGAGFGLAPHATGYTASANLWQAPFASSQWSAPTVYTYLGYLGRRYGSSLGAAASRLPQAAGIGDSITYGYQLTSPGTQNWLAQMSSTLAGQSPAVSITTADNGIVGRTAATALTTVETDVCSRVTGLAPSNVVYVYLGTNDLLLSATAATLESTITSYFAAARALAPTAKLIAFSLQGNAAASRGTWDAQQPIYNAWIQANWSTIGANALVDLASIPDLQVATNTTYFQSDFTHPTVAGQAVIAAAALAATAQWL